jgi:hypothetical protein
MDVAGGFSKGLLFYDIAISTTSTVQIWSGLDGSGTKLAQQNIPLVPVSNEVFSGQIDVPFSGLAQSVVFSGGNDQLVLDNISFLASVPEPSSWVPLATGMGCAFLAFARWRRKPRRGASS